MSRLFSLFRPIAAQRAGSRIQQAALVSDTSSSNARTRLLWVIYLIVLITAVPLSGLIAASYFLISDFCDAALADCRAAMTYLIGVGALSISVVSAIGFLLVRQ